jgi:hypothetical protein
MMSSVSDNRESSSALAALWRDLCVYVGRIREFDRTDWLVYLAWVGLMLGLTFATGGFLLYGLFVGARFPEEAFLVPFGAAIFSLAIAVDTIGHRTIYKEVLRGGEALVHHIIIFAGITSCVLLCAAYLSPSIFVLPALLLTILSFVYSLFDEALHWRRYLMQNSDRIEMWSHVFILVGHGVMMLAWWRWYWLGYTGVAETVQHLPLIS